MEALEKLLGVVNTFGEMQTADSERVLDYQENQQVQAEDVEKQDAKDTSESNNFLTKMMQNMSPQNKMMNEQQVGSNPL
jgi:hypothetical protein